MSVRKLVALVLLLALSSPATSFGTEPEPQTASGYIERAAARMGQGDSGGAIDDCTRAIELAPRSAAAYSYRGYARASEGDNDGAVADCSRAIHLNPKDRLGWFNRAFALLSLGKYEAAIVDYSQAIVLDRKDASSYCGRAGARLLKGDLAEAASDFRTACDLEPSDDYARFGVWIAFSRQGKTDFATAELTEYLKQVNSSGTHQWSAKIGAFLIGRLGEAELLKAAASSDARMQRGMQCEAYYYAGCKRLIDADPAGAFKCFEESVATGRRDFSEYQRAAAEIVALRAPQK